MPAIVGLDIGTSAVRGVQVTAGARRPVTLERLGQVTLPAGVVRDGEILEPDAVIGALCTLWARYGFSGRKVALGLASPQVIVRELDLPYWGDDRLRAALPFEVQDHLPLPVQQVVLDFQTIERYEIEDGRHRSRILLVAVPRPLVDRVVGVVRTARLHAVELDLAAFALLRSLASTRETDADGELLLDIGASVTNVVVHRGGRPRVVRILPMGGSDLTEALASGLGLSEEQAELAKTSGLLELEGGIREHADKLVEEHIDRLVSQLRAALGACRAAPDSTPVSRIVLSGGTSQLAGLNLRLSESLGMPVVQGHPMEALRVGTVGLRPEQLAEAEPFLAVAIGLALGTLRSRQ